MTLLGGGGWVGGGGEGSVGSVAVTTVDGGMAYHVVYVYNWGLG
jgi:hypothetical protein